MKKLLAILVSAILFTSCVTNGVIDNNSTFDAKEANAENKVYLNELVRNEEVAQKIDDKLVIKMDNAIGLLDELDLAIALEKRAEYNRGVVDGKAAAKAELEADGYVIFKKEDLVKLDLWKED